MTYCLGIKYEIQIIATLSQQLSWRHSITSLPLIKWFADKLNRAMELVKMNDNLNKERT